MCKERFRYTEGCDSDRERVIAQIENQDFTDDPLLFYNSLSKTKHPLMLSNYDIDSLAALKLYKVTNLSMGFALSHTDSGFTEIVAVHNNEPQYKNMGETLLRTAIRLGGNYLSHFGSDKLNHLYESVGLVTIRVDDFDPSYDPQDEFQATYGPLPVYYRILKEA